MKLFTEEAAYDKFKKELDPEIFNTLEKINPEQKEKGVTEWIIKQYIKNKNILQQSEKITAALINFKNLKRIKKLQENDINKYDLQKILHLINVEATSGKQEKKEILKGAKKLYEDNQWLLIIPKTYDSACHYGAGTKWCTASKIDRKKYDEYMTNGYLMFLINKNSKEKYSMSKQRTSFVNAVDTELSSDKIKDLLNKLPTELASIIEKDGVSFAYRRIKEKIIKKIPFTALEAAELKNISDELKNKLLNTILAKFNNDNEIHHAQFKKIIENTNTISKGVFTMAKLSVDDSFYVDYLKRFFS